MPHTTQTGPLRSAFSIIELDFKVPFTNFGPPKFLSDIWAQCLRDIKTEEHWVRTMWSRDLDAPSKVFIVVGWDTDPLWRGPGDSVSDMTEAFALATARLEAKGMPRAVDSLSEFLTASPNINCIVAPEDIPTLANKTCCNLLLVRSPSSGSLFEAVDAELKKLKELCFEFCNRKLCGPRAEAAGDIFHYVFGVDVRTGAEGYVNGVCTFVFLVFWDSAEAMKRFKDPGQESFGKCRQKIDQDWWTREVLGRVEKFKDEGAWVRTGTLDFDIRSRFRPDWTPAADKQGKSLADKVRTARKRFLNAFCGK